MVLELPTVPVGRPVLATGTRPESWPAWLSVVVQGVPPVVSTHQPRDRARTRPRSREPKARQSADQKPAIDATRAWEAADIIEQMVGAGFHLAHTHRMGWLLRQLESWPDWRTGRSWNWVDVDSAPEGQLGALLLRHQDRQRTAPPSD